MRGLHVSSRTHLQASNVQMNAHLRLHGFWGNIKKLVKERLNAAAETLLEGKQRDELCEKIKQIPIWAATTTRKSEMLSDDTLSQLHAAVQSAPSLAIDESSDVTDNSQLLVNVRLFHQDKKEICEDLLGLTPLETLFCLLEMKA